MRRRQPSVIVGPVPARGVTGVRVRDSDGAAPDDRPWSRRLWARLGFGDAAVMALPGPEDDAGLCVATIRVVSVLDWRDRLRVLISGRVVSGTKLWTRGHAPIAGAASTFAVLPPGQAISRYDIAAARHRGGR